MAAVPGRGATYAACPEACGAAKSRGVCRIDGTCECVEAWTGLKCDVPAISVVREVRGDGTAAYEHDTNGTTFSEAHVSSVVLDGVKGVAYVYAYDSGGVRVVEVDARYPESFTSGGITSRGWGANGPRRELTGATPPAIAPDTGYCGVETSSSCTAKHPRAYGRVDPAKSRGWYGVHAELSLILDPFDISLTSVIVPVNMWKPNEENKYKFALYQYVGTACTSDPSTWASCVLGSSSSGTPSKFELSNFILDAVGVSNSNGMMVYKATHEDGVSKGIIGHVNKNMQTQQYTPLSPGLMKSRCPECANAPDALRIETSTNYSESGVNNYVIFAGSALLDYTDRTFYPALYKVNANPNVRDGDGEEMYVVNTTIAVPEACEGQRDTRQGRFSTFTAITSHGEFGYVGTSGRDSNCAQCNKRAACIFMFHMSFSEGDGPLAVLVLDGELGERDALSAIVVPSTNSGEKDYMYWTVGSGDNSTSRIVKIEIGGVDTSRDCVTGCFKRVGTFKENFPIGGITPVPGEHRIFAVSSGATTKYAKYSTSVISRVEPTHVSSLTSGTTVKIIGSGFHSPSLGAGLSHSIACRFGHTNDANDGFANTSWSPGTYISPFEISCVTPSAANSSSTNIGYSEVQVSFDGFPSDSSDPNGVWQKSLWNSAHLYLRYHDPAVIVATNIGTEEASVLYTGEDADNLPVDLRIAGGPFINSPDLKCRFHGDDTSVTNAIFVSAIEIKCKVCKVVSGRCSNPVGSPLPWLPSGQPAEVEVEVSLNGVDFGDSKGKLRLHGLPVGVKLLDGPKVERAITAASGFSVGTFQVGLVDVNETLIAYDRGEGGTKGFNISAVISGPSNVAISDDTSSATTTEGVASFVPALTAAPAAGEYKIIFTATDCTKSDGSCVMSLSVQAEALFSVQPGPSAGLSVTPGRALTRFMISDPGLFPADVIALPATQNTSIGYLIVDLVDSGGSALQSLSKNDVVVTASLVTSTVDSSGIYVARTTGAQLIGTLNRTTSDGRALFSDLSLIAAAPSGSRVVGSADDITYGEATRGDFGEASKYILQLSAVVEGVSYSAHAIIRIDLGKPSYLRVNNTYSKRTIYAEAPEQPIGEIIIGAYDSGNNFVGTAETSSRSVTVTASAGINLAGNLQVERDDTGVWRFSDLKVLGPAVGDFGLTFSSPDLPSVLQVVSVLDGDAGYELSPSLSTLSTVTAGPAVSLDSFSLSILDKSGTSLGTFDKHSTGDTVAPNRTIQVSSETLALSGSTVLFTNGNGQVSVTGLVAESPKVGSHTLIVSETSAHVSGEQREGKLQRATVTVTVVVGAVSGFKVISPKTFEFSSSFTDSIQASEATAYSAGHTVPLSDFVIVPVDGAGNELPTGTSPSGVTLTATMNDTSRAVYPYILGTNETAIAKAAVLTVYSDTLTYPRTGSLKETNSSGGDATFSGLHLVKPQTGTYTLIFTSSDPNLNSASVDLNITPGTSVQLGLLPYCDLVDGECQTTVNCTCHRYRSALKVQMHPIIVDVLDGAFNFVGDFHTKSCETCPDRSVQLSPENVTVCRWIEVGVSCECAGNSDLASASSTPALDKVQCISLGVLSVLVNSGRGSFDDLIIPYPRTGMYAVSIHSPGLLGVKYHFSVQLGSAAKFVLERTQASGSYKSGVRTSIVNATNSLTGRLYDGGDNFLYTASTGSIIFVRCKTAALSDYPQGINPVIGGTTYAMACANSETCASMVRFFKPACAELFNFPK